MVFEVLLVSICKDFSLFQIDSTLTFPEVVAQEHKSCVFHKEKMTTGFMFLILLFVF